MLELPEVLNFFKIMLDLFLNSANNNQITINSFFCMKFDIDDESNELFISKINFT